MATSVDAPNLSDLHMLVLVTLAVYGRADADAIAGWLELPAARDLVRRLGSHRAA